MAHEGVHGSLMIASPVTVMTAYFGERRRRRVKRQCRTDSTVLPLPEYTRTLILVVAMEDGEWSDLRVLDPGRVLHYRDFYRGVKTFANNTSSKESKMSQEKTGKEMKVIEDDDEPDEWSVFQMIVHPQSFSLTMTRDKRIFSTGCSGQ